MLIEKNRMKVRFFLCQKDKLDAGWGGGEVVGFGVAPDAKIVLPIGFVAVWTLVVKVQKRRAITQLNAVNARIFKTLSELAVFRAIAHTRIKTVCLKDIFPPRGSVAAIPAGICRSKDVE